MRCIASRPSLACSLGLVLLPLGLALVGCGDPSTGDPTPEATTGGETTAADASTTGEEPGSTGAADTTGQPEPPADSSSTGEPPPGDGECDVWAQDCAEGEKCVPWADDGGDIWNATRCVPVMGTGQPGDTCMLFGGEITGMDDCALGSICMRLDDGTDNGVCVPQCLGSEEAPACVAADRTCTISNDGVLTLCMQQCDPTSPSCPAGMGCYPSGDAYELVCWPDFSGDVGVYGDPCFASNSCDPGLICIIGGFVPGCEGDACCSEYCDLNDPDPAAACMGQPEGQMCRAFYEGDAPPGLEHVGVCALPM